MSDVQIPLNADFLQNMSNQINALDSKLDRSSGSKTSYRNTIERELTSQYNSEFQENISKIVDWAQSLGDEPRAGFYFLLVNSLEDTFGKQIDAMLDARAEDRAKQAVPLPADEEQKIRDERKKLADQWKAAHNLLVQWDADLTGVSKPKTRRGAPAGDRGPRALSRFDYKIGGMPVASDKNGLGPIASTIFGIKVSELKAMIKEASEGKLDPSNADDLPDTWDVTLTHPGTKDEIVLSAVRQEQYRENEDDDDEDGTVADEPATENSESPQATQVPETQAPTANPFA